MSALYIHIPFCKKICYYCDFYFSLSLKNKSEIVVALAKEIELRSSYLDTKVLKTIYFGGGTPSVLTYDEISFLFEIIDQHFDLSQLQEVSFEANPDDLSPSYLKELIRTPINRLSIGIQSFNDTDLKLMNRRHTADEAISCLHSVFNEGFSNVTADLMYSLPNMTVTSLDFNIQSLLQFPINHISAYNLTLEKGTAFSNFSRKGTISLLSDDESIKQGTYLRNALADNGFEQYEISNFARNGSYSIHNTSYWNQINYLGIGPSSHSYNGSSRQWNVSNNRKYLAAVSGGTSFYESEFLSITDKYNEYIFTGLRTKWGVSTQYIFAKFGDSYVQSFVDTVEQYIANNQMFKDGDNFILTDSGKAIADGIASDLFVVD